MNEATPPWRTFSSDAQPRASADAQAEVPTRVVPRWLMPVLAALGGGAASAAVLGAVMLVLDAQPADPGDPSPPQTLPGSVLAEAAVEPPAAPVELVVDVAGAVALPGLHRLTPGARVGDAIEAAGGFAPRADLAATSQGLNLAQLLEDGAKVLVPELGVDRPATADTTAADGRIDVNRAGRSELESLPGIGPVTAGKIIAAREQERFGAVRELRSRGLVGESVYEDIKGLVHAG